MKNLFHLLLTSILLLSLASCSDDDDDNIKFYIAEYYNADGTPSLVSANTLSANIGSGCDLTIKGGSGTYTVTSDNEDVAEVVPNSIFPNSFFISTKKNLGSATILVKDSKGNQSSITITAERYRIQYVVKEAYTYIAVEEGKTLDENIKKAIEDEVAERLIPAKYTFNLIYDKPESGELKITNEGKTEYTGTFTETRDAAYHWSLDVKYNDKEAHYLITKLELLLKEKSTGPIYIDIVEDLTDIYKNKYPHQGVTKVYAVMNSLYRYNPVEI